MGRMRPNNGHSALRLAITAAVAVFLMEVSVMLLLPRFELGVSSFARVVADAVLLVLVLIPVLFFAFYRPLALRIQALQEARHELRSKEARYRAFVDAMPDLLFRLSRAGDILDCGGADKSSLYADPARFVGRNIRDLLPADAVTEAMDTIERAFLTREMQHFEHRLPVGGGDLDFEARLVVAGQDEVVAVVRDMTQLKLLENELRELSLTDDLTGLYNRRGFFALASQQIRLADRQKEPIYLLYADMDNLKETNDRHGHHAGDRLLKEAAALLRENFRSSDIVGRIGGDEFVVIPIDASIGSAETILSRLQARLDTLNAQEGREHTLSLSAGTALYDPRNPLGLEDLLKEADRQMYERKKRKR